MEQREEVTETAAGERDGDVHKRVVTSSSSTGGLERLGQLIYLLFAILEVILAIRIILSLLGANRGNGFAQFIYSFSYPFVQPFFGLFGYHFRYGVSAFELDTLVAMIVYALIAWVIVSLIRIGSRN